MPTPLWIIVLSFNGLADTRRCLTSLETSRDKATILMVDNASTEDEAAAVRTEFPWVRTLRNASNEGYAGGNNRGIELAIAEGAEWIVLLNNDTVVAADFAERMQRAAGSDRFGVIGPVIAYMDEPDHVRSDGVEFNVAGRAGFFERQVVPLEAGLRPRIVETDIVNGCCMMISARLVTAIGFIDERFFLIHEESDFCLRAREAGFACGILPQMLVWHKGSSSFRRAGNGLQRYYDARNLALLLSKHTGWRGRGALATWYEYIRYVYFLYCIEREQGTPESVTGVLDGIHDGITRTFGPRRPRARRFLALLRGVLETKQRMRVSLRMR